MGKWEPASRRLVTPGLDQQTHTHSHETRHNRVGEGGATDHRQPYKMTWSDYVFFVLIFILLIFCVFIKGNFYTDSLERTVLQ